MNENTTEQELQDRLMDQLKTQASSVNTATQGFSPNGANPSIEPQDFDDVFDEFGRPPTTPNFVGILGHLEEDLDLNQVIAVDREIGDIIAMPRVVALALQRWLQWEVQTRGENRLGSSGTGFGHAIAMFAKKMSRRKLSTNSGDRLRYDKIREHCRAECDQLNLSEEMWPIVALHEELEQRGAFG